MCVFVCIYSQRPVSIMAINGVCETHCHTVRKCNFNCFPCCTFTILNTVFSRLSKYIYICVYMCVDMYILGKAMHLYQNFQIIR